MKNTYEDSAVPSGLTGSNALRLRLFQRKKYRDLRGVFFVALLQTIINSAGY
jgi:hypothetical protein